MHAKELTHAVAYFNTDVGVAGPNFDASAVPSLQEFVREVTREVPSPKGGTVYEQWKLSQETTPRHRGPAVDGDVHSSDAVRVGDLGSGSDFTPFIQHLGVPSTDIGSSGPYGVYHSTFDDYTWFTKFADPTFVYLQQQAQVLGLEALNMADADLLPYDYAAYGGEVVGYLQTAQQKAAKAGMQALDFSPALTAAQRFRDAGAKALASEKNPSGDLSRQNELLRHVEEDLLSPHGLPNRPWYKHTIYAPGEYTGYAAVVIPGVNEAIDAGDAARATSQLEVLTHALDRAVATLNKLP